ncbi:hypothetical protein EMCG_04842 [[Emmonsia] crescens]|uniref:Uncharacterized protein n=1 Tax=[Emmonsia] crescens TaxID=73230 RepID=A0A0G2HR56_9EURO|nr:hypothetical protein EMCG_04842 [Emmonsia crescens UAMH 3008]
MLSSLPTEILTAILSLTERNDLENHILIWLKRRVPDGYCCRNFGGNGDRIEESTGNDQQDDGMLDDEELSEIELHDNKRWITYCDSSIKNEVLSVLVRCKEGGLKSFRHLRLTSYPQCQNDNIRASILTFVEARS